MNGSSFVAQQVKDLALRQLLHRGNCGAGSILAREFPHAAGATKKINKIKSEMEKENLHPTAQK